MNDVIHLELKYCERCGGLVLRRAGLRTNLCKSCQRIDRDLPPLTHLRPHAHRRHAAVVVPFRPAPVRSAQSSSDMHACCEGEQA